MSFGWYPTGLNSGHLLQGNYLRTTDTFPDMLRPELARMPRIVYEFDAPDLMTGTMYPAMTRTFRSVGTHLVAAGQYKNVARVSATVVGTTVEADEVLVAVGRTPRTSATTPTRWRQPSRDRRRPSPSTRAT